MPCPRLLPLILLACCVLAGAAENAALEKFGATISITADGPKPVNERWAKASDLLKEKPKGPIIDPLATARVTISFPMTMHVSRVSVTPTDYKEGFARAKTIDIKVDDRVLQTLEIPADATGPQGVDVKVETNRITFQVTAAHPPLNGGDTPYGGFNAIEVLVDDDLAAVYAAPQGFPDDLPVWIMPTANLDARPDIKVIGSPRTASGHPCTIWDAQDIADFKQQIATVPAAKEAYERCLAGCEGLVAKPLTVPDEPDLGTNPAVATVHTRVAEGIATLGIGYALSGDERYAEAAKQLLLQLAARYEGWPVHAHPKFSHDKSKWSWQRLGDAIWLIQAAWGFDLIQGSKALTQADHDQIRDHFVMPCVKQILSSASIIAAPTNWSAICCAAVMVGARSCDDQEYFEKAVYGLSHKVGAEPKIGGNKGGIFHFIDNAIDDDGMWAEGAIGYQFMAMRGLVVMAETMWHNGIDVYGYQNSKLKLVFDSPIWYCYPGGRTSPAIHDSGSENLFGRDAHLYQYASRRYGDRTYDSILSKVTPSFASVFNLFMPACDFKPVEAIGLPVVPSTLFPGVGFATTRTGAGDESKYLLVDYGPNRSHGHPDKLSHCLYALGQELFADGGSAWYSTDIYREYYSTTLAHNTVLANGGSQIPCGGRLEAFCQAGDLALIRAGCDDAIPATGLDRTLVLFGDRLYDIYRLGSAAPMTFDLPYHSHGLIAAVGELDGALTPWEDEDRLAKGYSYFEEPRIAPWDQDWSCAWSVKGGTMRMHAIGEKGTTLILGKTPKGGGKLGTVLVRRLTTSTVFASVCDLIPKGGAETLASVIKVEGTGGYALVATLKDGSVETVLVNSGAAKVTVGEWATDARVAAVRTKGGSVDAFIIAGGTAITGPGCDLTLSTPSLISAYAVGDGLARVTNHGTASVDLIWKGLTATTVAPVDASGTWGATMAVKGGGFSVPARTGVDLATGTQPTVASREAEVRAVKQRTAAEAEALRQKEQQARIAEQQAAAAKEPIPADYVVVMQAEDFTGQGGGEVSIATNKAAVMGTCFSQWNDRGHWLEYTCEVQHPGWYQVAIKYCIEGDSATRSVAIDGQPPEPALAEIVVPGTGGWSNGVDNWSLVGMPWPGSETPYLVHLTAGAHVIRLDNTAGGGMNMDYLMLAPSTVQVSRSLVEK